jgi:hypothetical protein
LLISCRPRRPSSRKLGLRSEIAETLAEQKEFFWMEVDPVALRTSTAFLEYELVALIVAVSC